MSVISTLYNLNVLKMVCFAEIPGSYWSISRDPTDSNDTPSCRSYDEFPA